MRAAGGIGVDGAGAGLLRSRRGPLVLEVTSAPGLEGIENTTGLDVAGEIVDYMALRVARRRRDAARANLSH